MNNVDELYYKFCDSTIKFNLRSTTKKGVIKELVSALSLEANVRNILIKTLLKRESMGSTGVGKGIAIPHARTLLVKDFKLVIGVSKKGVEFDSFDGKPVFIFFMLIAPPEESSNSYLITLGKVAEFARSIALNGKLFKAANEKEFLEVVKEIEEKTKP